MKLIGVAFLFVCLFTISIVNAQKGNLARPELKDGIYRITLNSDIEINPASGARVTSLKLDGTDFLTGPAINPKYWGSSFWLSPQKDWNDFSHILDNIPFKASVENNVIKLTSGKDSSTGLIFSREISGNLKTNFFTIKYSITNASTAIHKIAPWEVTRVNINGLAFFPRGEGERWGSMASMAEDSAGITWFKHDAVTFPPKHLKLFSDGKEGWVAQVNNNVIFIKIFPDMALQKAAPSEAEIEIYTNQDRTYVEIEDQGAYETLQPGASMNWEVSWFIGKLPANIKPVKGNSDLPKYVRRIVKTGNL